MADLISDGVAWLATQLKANASGPVTYSRGAVSVTLQVTYGQSKLLVADGPGTTRIVRPDLDIWFTLADLGSLIKPRDDDVVTIAVGGPHDGAYIVKSPGGKEGSFHISGDQGGALVQVHLKYRGVS